MSLRASLLGTDGKSVARCDLESGLSCTVCIFVNSSRDTFLVRTVPVCMLFSRS